MTKARTDALRLLKFRPRSEAELKERLARKGTGALDVEALIREFKEKGLLDDARFARLFATQRTLSRPVGKRRILDELAAKGVDPSLAQGAVEEATQGRDDLSAAMELGKRRMGRLEGLSKDAARRRLFGFLGRRGYPGDVVWKVVRELLP